jgi:hypothetical protein
MSVPVDTAEALTAMLAGAAMSQVFECERSYADWELALDDTDEGKLRIDVAVVTTKQVVEQNARGNPLDPKLVWTIPIDIAIRKKFLREHQDDATGRVAVEEVDVLMEVVQELVLFLWQKRLDGHPAAIWSEPPTIAAAPVTKHLRENRQFTAVIRLAYRVTP